MLEKSTRITVGGFLPFFDNMIWDKMLKIAIKDTDLPNGKREFPMRKYVVEHL